MRKSRWCLAVSTDRYLATAAGCWTLAHGSGPAIVPTPLARVRLRTQAAGQEWPGPGLQALRDDDDEYRHHQEGNRPDSVSSQLSIRSQLAADQRRNTGDQSGESGNQEHRQAMPKANK
jgi:hypothetical protein